MKPLPSAAVSEGQRRRGVNPTHGDANHVPVGGATAWQQVKDGIGVAVGDRLPPHKASPSNMAVLLQNCDLPPPQKLFSPDDLVANCLAPTSKPTFFSSSPIKTKPYLGDDHDLSRLIRDAAGEDKHKSKDTRAWVEDDLSLDDGRTGKETGGLLKAMRLSQTRAREAEAKASQLGKTTQRISLLLLDESMRLRAYRQWVRLLQAEIATLENRRSARGTSAAAGVDPASTVDEESESTDCSSGTAVGSTGSATWMAWAVVLAVGVAGVGLAVGCKYLF